MRTRAIRKNDGSLAPYTNPGSARRPWPVQAKSAWGTFAPDKKLAEGVNAGATSSRPGVSFGDINVLDPRRRPFRDGTGSPLPRELRKKMESAFDADFSDVRVHQDAPDARALSALAFTQGRDIHFAPGQYNPASAEGEKIIAHELAHVVQQREGRVKPSSTLEGGLFQTDESLERDADVKGDRAASGHPAVPRQSPDIARASSSTSPGRESPSGAPVQPLLTIGGDADYREQVRQQLQMLAAEGANVNVGEEGNVNLTGDIDEEAITPSHRLLNRIIQNERTTAFRPRVGNEPAQAEPENPRGNMRAVGDFFGDLFHWRQWGDTRRLRDRASAGNRDQGASSYIPYDPQLAAEERRTRVLNPDTGEIENEAAPQQILMAHELIHADHFQRGVGAFNQQGRMYQGIAEHTTGQEHPQRHQESQFVEEMNTVGLESAENPEQRFTQDRNLPLIGFVPALTGSPTYMSGEQRAERFPEEDLDITENDIREQFGIRRRVAY